MPKLIEQLTTDFSQGMYDSVAATRHPPASAALIRNGRIEPDGTVRRRPGGIRTTSAAVYAGTAGYGAIHFTTADGDDQIVAFFGDKAFYSFNDGATWNEIASGLLDYYYSFATMRVGATNYLFAANGDATIKSWDGTTWSTVSNAPSGVKYIATFNSRLYAAGHSGVLVQACKIGDPDTWATPDGLTVQVSIASGDPPTALFQIGEHLLVFHKDSTSYIDGYGEQTLIVAEGATGFSRSVGCAGFRTIAGVGDDGVAFLSRRGVEYYASGAGIRLVTRSIEEFMATIDWEAAYISPERMSAVYDSKQQNYHLAVATTGSRNNRSLVLNIRENVEDQRRGKVVAATVDRPLDAAVGVDYTFEDDGGGYLTTAVSGLEMTSDANGYAELGGVGDTGDPMSDALGYLISTTFESMQASLFVVPGSSSQSVVHSLGYDGFVRKHADVDNDDMDSDETGGIAVTLTLISRPYLMKRPRHRKRARILHVASIQETAATLTVRVRGAGTTSADKNLSMSALGVDHADRARTRVNLKADDPQVEVRSDDDVRISLVGLSAEIMREPA